MRLVSLTFLALCLPAAAAVYRMLPARARVGALLALDLAFYCLAAGSVPWLLPLLAAATALAANSRLARGVCAATLAVLFFVCRAVGILPMGFAFFVLRAVGFLLDEREKQPPAAVVAYLLFFPAVTMGPLFDFDTFRAGLAAPPDTKRRADAVCRLARGLVRKFVFADPLLAAYRDLAMHGTTLGAAVTLVAFSLYLYFDFAGYSDIAVAVGGIFGFDLPENFDYPYVSRSVGEFFRRWHATLGKWLFRHVYLPLGGSRQGMARTLLSLAAVWLCTALWHGATACYLLWGVYFFVLLAVEKLCFPKGFRIGILPTLLLVLPGWVFFFSDGFAAASDFFGRLFCLGGTLLYSRADLYDVLRYAPFLLLSALAATPLFRDAMRAVCRRLGDLPRHAAALCGFVLALAYAAAGGYTPFLYASY